MSALRLLAAVMLALLGLGLCSTPARAVGEVATSVEIRPLEPVVIGTVVHAVVELRRADGTLIPDEPVALALDGVHVRRTRTAADGTASIRLPADMTPGQHELVATYGGRRNQFLGSSGRTTLEVRSYQLEVHTVPSLPGMVFSVDGERFAAGDDGIARLPVSRAGEHQLAVHVEEYTNPDHRVEFSRWNTELFGPEITIRIPYDKQLQSGFDIFHRASQTFVDVEGAPIDDSRVESITLRSSLGIEYENPDGGERWYKSSRTVRRPNGLESVDVRYNVDSVITDGSNVVNAGQQRFYLTGHSEWTIELLLFSARMKTSDALFGFPAGTQVDVTFPDGDVERVLPTADGTLEVRGLARGEYRMKVADAPGWAPAVPVALSRDQEVVLRVVTYLDMAVSFVVASGLAFGLLHVGRPHLLPGTARSIARGARAVVTSPLRLRSYLMRARPRGVWQASRVAKPTPAVEPARVTLSQVVAASIAARPAAVEAEPGTVALHETSEPQVVPSAPRTGPLLASGIGHRLELTPPPGPQPSASDQPALPSTPAGEMPKAPEPSTAPKRARRAPTSPSPRLPATDEAPKGTGPKRKARTSRPPKPTATPAPPVEPAKARAGTAPRSKAGARVATDADAATASRQRIRSRSSASAEKPTRKAAAKKATADRAAGRAPKAAKRAKAERDETKATRSAAAAPKAGARPGRRARAAGRGSDDAKPAKAAPADATAARKPATKSAGAKGRRPAKPSATKPRRAQGTSVTDKAPRAPRSPRARGSSTLPGRSRRPGRLDDAIERVVRRRAAWVPPSESDAPALRRSQLAALGISDPGEETHRESTPLPSNAKHEALGRARQQPSAMWRLPVTMDAGMHGCEKCGMPLWAGVRYCRRCGWLQLPEPLKSSAKGGGR